MCRKFPKVKSIAWFQNNWDKPSVWSYWQQWINVSSIYVIILASAEGQCPGTRASESDSGEGRSVGFCIWPREVWWPAGRVRCCHQKPRASAHPTASKEEQITGPFTYNICIYIHTCNQNCRPWCVILDSTFNDSN